jgi:hypothetical protein
MIPTVNYVEILDKLSRDPDYWTRDGRSLRVTMCGLLFARPQTELASKEVFTELEYFDRRLGRRFHLFTAGCFPRWIPAGRYPDARHLTVRDWRYSDKAFDDLRREIESVTSWKYKDGVELLLFNATKNRKTEAVSLDFHSALAIDLQELRRFRTSETVAYLIGRIANYCDEYEADDPTWGFSDQIGTQVGVSALWNLLVGFLPEGIRTDANAARLFVTQDLSKKGDDHEIRLG